MARPPGAGTTNKHRHAPQGLLGLPTSSLPLDDEDDDPEDDSPSMKDRRRRRRAQALFQVLPVLQELDSLQRRISRGRRVRVVVAVVVVLFLVGSVRWLSSSGDGGVRASKGKKVVKGSNLNKLDMPMRTVGGVRVGMCECFYLKNPLV